ncbi:MAG: DUF4352 domain-containing protein, partial [Caulobacteraceae bacterium]
MGAPLKTGDLELTVTGVETRDRVGIPYAYEEASEGAVLVVVKTKLKNTGTKPVQAFETPTMSLVDSAGTTYSADIAKTTAYQ